MSDIFTAALEELRGALTDGEAVDAAIEEIGQEHGLKPDALRRRAERAFGDLTTYGVRNAAQQAVMIQAEVEAKEVSEMRRLLNRMDPRNVDLTDKELALASRYVFRHRKFGGND